MAFLHLRPGDYRAMPWKDGGGLTEEIAIEPPDATLAAGFLWRLSLARVARSGPFSRFEGCDRSLVLLEGALELELGGHGRARLEAPSEPFAFSGDWDARATLLKGPVRDLGVICDRARIRQEVRAAALEDGPVRIEATPTAWIIALTGQCILDPQGLELAPLEAARLDSEPSEVKGLSPDARVLLVRFEPRS